MFAFGELRLWDTHTMAHVKLHNVSSCLGYDDCVFWCDSCFQTVFRWCANTCFGQSKHFLFIWCIFVENTIENSKQILNVCWVDVFVRQHRKTNTFASNFVSVLFSKRSRQKKNGWVLFDCWQFVNTKVQETWKKAKKRMTNFYFYHWEMLFRFRERVFNVEQFFLVASCTQ